MMRIITNSQQLQLHMTWTGGSGERNILGYDMGEYLRGVSDYQQR